MRELTEQGRSIYELDGVGLRGLKPDLIVTQALCSVCAVSVDDVRAIAAEMDPVPEIVSLDPHTLGEVLGDVRTLAQATDAKDAGVDLVQDAAARIDRVKLAVRDAPQGPRRDARVARSDLRRRPLGPAADRVRRRRRPARPARASPPSSARGRRSPRRGPRS